MAGRKSENRFPLTKTKILSLPAPDKGRIRYFDSEIPGLVLAITPGGAKTFYLYRKVDGRPVEYKLGRFPDISVEQARKSAARRGVDYGDGKDPQAERKKRRTIATLKALFDEWMEDAKLRKRTWKDDIWMFGKYFAPLENKRLDMIRRPDVAAWHRKIGKESGKTIGNRCKWLLNTLFNFAPKIGYEGQNPVKDVDDFPEESRERYLLPQEMKAFFDAVAAEPPLWKDFFTLLLLTGQRRGNVASARWDEIDLVNAIWTVPASKSKAKRPITIPLSPPAYAIIKRRRDEIEKNTPWVFPGEGAEGCIVDPKKSWSRILKNSGIENLRMHDLRRSLGSWQAALGASLAIIGRSLGHNDLQSTQVYARLQLDPVRESVNAAGAAMLQAGGVVIDATVEKGIDNE